MEDDDMAGDERADDAAADADADADVDASDQTPIGPVGSLSDADAPPGMMQPPGCADCEPDGGELADASGPASRDDASAGPAADSGPDPVGPPCPNGPRVCTPNQRYEELGRCGSCMMGMRSRSRACSADGCGFGPFGEWSACAEDVECTPGESERQMENCGICNLGSRTRSRSCSPQTCEWPAEWGAWSSCSPVSPTCMPGQVQTETQNCGACNTGRQTRTRTCSNACGWGAWSAWGACGGVTAACTPGQTTGCSPGDSCGHRVCSNSCTWGGCVPRVANGCLRRRNGTQEEGSNYRCCSGGRWQFCLPDCHWSAECAACSPANCEC